MDNMACKLCGHDLRHHGPGTIPVIVFCDDCPNGACATETRSPKESD